MRSVILISAESLDLSALTSAYDGIGSACLQSPERLVVKGEWGWFAVGIEEGLVEEFSDSELSRVREIVANPVFLQLEYSSSEAADLAIGRFPHAVWVDNDHGMLRPIEEVQMCIQQGLEWQSSPT